METKVITETYTTSRILIAENLTYFVVGRTLRGGRITSPEMDFEKALDTYNDYQDVVHYFGGGTVTMYSSTFEGDIINSCVVW